MFGRLLLFFYDKRDPPAAKDLMQRRLCFSYSRGVFTVKVSRCERQGVTQSV